MSWLWVILGIIVVMFFLAGAGGELGDYDDFD